MNLIGKRYLYFGISLLIIVPGMLALILWGLPLAIDFTGGSVLDVQFNSGTAPQDAQVIALYSEFGYTDTQVQSSGTNQLIIHTKDMPDEVKAQIVSAMEKRFNSTITINQFDSVGPVIGQEVTGRAASAVGLAALGILIYITFAFRGVPHAFRYGTAAIIAMLHDVLVVVGMEALLGHFVGWEADSLFLTALLTVIGFSVHDTICLLYTSDAADDLLCV